MGKIEELAAVYEEHIGAPWQRTLAGAQRVTIVVYDKELERTLRARVDEFEQATVRAGHGWKIVDSTAWFSTWMSQDEYRDAYFDDPGLIGMKLEGEFRQDVFQKLMAELESGDENTVVALLGVASLYGFVRVSELVHAVEQSIPGRLVVFFPGSKNESNYRLLDARDGWNYLAQSVVLHSGG